MVSGKLNSYLADIDEQAQDMFFWLVKEYADRQAVTERLKAENQLLRCAEVPLRSKQRQFRELKKPMHSCIIEKKKQNNRQFTGETI